MKSDHPCTKWFFWMAAVLFLFHGCAAPPLKGVTPEGQKVFLGTTAIDKTKPYQTFAEGHRSEADKLVYLTSRIRQSEGLLFFHEGGWYEPREAYRGSLWTVRQEFKKGEDARGFIKAHVARAASGDPHLVKYPDGTVQIGYYVLMNELDLLEAVVEGRSVRGLLTPPASAGAQKDAST